MMHFWDWSSDNPTVHHQTGKVTEKWNEECIQVSLLRLTLNEQWQKNQLEEQITLCAFSAIHKISRFK